MEYIIDNAALEVRAKEEKSIKRQKAQQGKKTAKLQWRYTIDVLNSQLQEGRNCPLLKRIDYDDSSVPKISQRRSAVAEKNETERRLVKEVIKSLIKMKKVERSLTV